MWNDGSMRARGKPPSNVATLAKISAVVIIVILYALGGISLYVRAHLLQPSATAAITATPRPTLTPTPFPSPTLAPPTVTPSLTSTLYPTATPKALGR